MPDAPVPAAVDWFTDKKRPARRDRSPRTQAGRAFSMSLSGKRGVF